MSDEEFQKIITEQKIKLDAIYQSVEKTRRYFMWTLIISVVCIVLPLVGLLLIIPQLMNTYSELLTF